MDISQIDINELNPHECRICLVNGNTELISPCNCQGTQKYVHQECLNRWRLENINNEKYRKCEICNREFKFENIYSVELLLCYIPPIIKYKSIIIYILFIFFFGVFLWCIDAFSNFQSIRIISFGNSTQAFNNMIRSSIWLLLPFLLQCFTHYLIFI